MQSYEVDPNTLRTVILWVDNWLGEVDSEFEVYEDQVDVDVKIDRSTVESMRIIILAAQRWAIAECRKKQVTVTPVSASPDPGPGPGSPVKVYNDNLVPGLLVRNALTKKPVGVLIQRTEVTVSTNRDVRGQLVSNEVLVDNAWVVETPKGKRLTLPAGVLERMPAPSGCAVLFKGLFKLFLFIYLCVIVNRYARPQVNDCTPYVNIENRK